MRRLRPCLGFWWWSMRAAFKPRYRHRGITKLEFDHLMWKSLLPQIVRDVYRKSPLLERLEARRRCAA